MTERTFCCVANYDGRDCDCRPGAFCGHDTLAGLMVEFGNLHLHRGTRKFNSARYAEVSQWLLDRAKKRNAAALDRLSRGPAADAVWLDEAPRVPLVTDGEDAAVEDDGTDAVGEFTGGTEL